MTKVPYDPPSVNSEPSSAVNDTESGQGLKTLVYLIVNFILAASLGAAIWWCSPILTGFPEPVDSQSGYYFVALFFCGIVLGGIRPRLIGVYPAGIVFGQVLYVLLFFEDISMIAVGMIIMTLFSSLTLAGAFAGKWIRWVLADIESN